MEVDSYKLLVAAGSDKLADKVDEHLDKGYVLYGNPSLSQAYLDGEIRVLVAQAVVLPMEEEDEDDVYPANKE